MCEPEPRCEQCGQLAHMGDCPTPDEGNPVTRKEFENLKAALHYSKCGGKVASLERRLGRLGEVFERGFKVTTLTLRDVFGLIVAAAAALAEDDKPACPERSRREEAGGEVLWEGDGQVYTLFIGALDPACAGRTACVAIGDEDIGPPPAALAGKRARKEHPMADPTPDPRLLSEEMLGAYRAKANWASPAPWGPFGPKTGMRDTMSVPDGDFIARSREMVPALLAHIAAQQEQIKRLRGRNEQLRQHLDDWRQGRCTDEEDDET